MKDNYTKMHRTMSDEDILMKYSSVMETLSYIGNHFFPDLKRQLQNDELDEEDISDIQCKIYEIAYDMLDSCLEYIDWERLRFYKDLIDHFCYSQSKQVMKAICDTITALMLEEIGEISDFYGKLMWKIHGDEEREIHGHRYVYDGFLGEL